MGHRKHRAVPRESHAAKGCKGCRRAERGKARNCPDCKRAKKGEAARAETVRVWLGPEWRAGLEKALAAMRPAMENAAETMRKIMADAARNFDWPHPPLKRRDDMGEPKTNYEDPFAGALTEIDRGRRSLTERRRSLFEANEPAEHCAAHLFAAEALVKACSALYTTMERKFKDAEARRADAESDFATAERCLASEARLRVQAEERAQALSEELEAVKAELASLRAGAVPRPDMGEEANVRGFRDPRDPGAQASPGKRPGERNARLAKIARALASAGVHGDELVEAALAVNSAGKAPLPDGEVVAVCRAADEPSRPPTDAPARILAHRAQIRSGLMGVERSLILALADHALSVENRVRMFEGREPLGA